MFRFKINVACQNRIAVVPEPETHAPLLVRHGFTVISQPVPNGVGP